MSEAERVEPPEPHRCACVILRENGSHDHCGQMIADPDVPFCDVCVDRHVGSDWKPEQITSVPASYYTQNRTDT